MFSKFNAATTRYDAESGQVYQETEVRFTRKQRSDWIGELKAPGLLKRPRSNASGARPLFDIAKNQIARQIKGVGPEHLAEVPWRVAEKVYEEIESIHAESFHAWRTFAKAYTEDFHRPSYRYQLEIKQPSLPLSEYFTGITSPSSSWLTSVRISPKQTSTTDLITIAKISNLAVLDLSDGQMTIDNTASAFNERIVRSWAELASTEGAFKHLRALLIGWQENLSVWIFKYLDSFPSLCHLIVTDCPQIHQRNRPQWEGQALKSGWDARHAKKSAKSLKPILDDKAFYLGAVSGLYYTSQDFFEKLKTRTKPEVPARLPILECSFGNPKTWTHIIDEFPSTRTIWFDNTKISNNSAKYDGNAEPVPKVEQIKRSREVEVSTAKEVRSPPPKRNPGKLKPRRTFRDASELLAEFDSAAK